MHVLGLSLYRGCYLQSHKNMLPIVAMWNLLHDMCGTVCGKNTRLYALVDYSRSLHNYSLIYHI